MITSKKVFTRLILGVFCSFILVLTACSSDDSTGGGSRFLTFIGSALKGLPTDNSSSRANFDLFRVDISNTFVAGFFKLECHMNGSDNICPSGVTADSTTKYSSTTLLGLIYHTEMYLGNVYQSSGSYKTCGTTNGSELTGDPTYTGSTNLIIDPTNSLYDCVGNGSSGGASGTHYFLYSKSTAGEIYSFIVVRVAVPYEETTGMQYSILQGYVRNDTTTGTPLIIAFNLPGITDYSDQSDSQMNGVGIINTSTNRFIAHYIAGTNTLIAMGKAGYVDGSYVSGYFRVAANDGSAYNKCLLNAENPQEQTDNSNCSDVNAYFSSTTYWSNIQTYLGLSSADATNLSGYQAILEDGTSIGVTNPTASSDFPSSIP